MRRCSALAAALLALWLESPARARADGFLDDGVVENSDSRQSGVVATAVGRDGLFIAGLDFTSGTGSWRVEKRRLDDGDLVPSFGEGGILAVDPTPGWDGIHAILVDGRSLFLVGDADGEIRIEKRAAADGRLKTRFGVGGAVAFPGDDAVWVTSNAAALARDHLYVATKGGRILRIRADTGEIVGTVAGAASPPDTRHVASLAAGKAALFVGTGTPQGFRVEKIGLHRGRVIWQVDEPFTLVGCGPESPQALALVPGGVLIGGMREGLWHVQRRRRLDGAPVWSVTGTGRGDCDVVYDLVVAGDSFFAVGVHNSRRRIEKRRLTDGSLVEDFGDGGVLDGARRVREAFSAVSICGDLVVTGFASTVGSLDRWYSTRHDPISGTLAAGLRGTCAEGRLR